MAGPSATPVATLSPASPASGPLPPALEDVNRLLAEDIERMNTLIPKQLSSGVGLVEEIGHYIVESGGKRLRPIFVLLGAQAVGYSGNDHIRLAAVIEFLHTATLLHDDVVDHSSLRRGRSTANVVWGNAPSVLVGDFLYSRAFQLMVSLRHLGILEVLSNATNTIAEGEVLQLTKLGDLALTEAQYLEVIRCKTALLFEAATHTGALLAEAPADEVERLRAFGGQFGVAYQLMDDYLDYTGDAESLGKNVGDDLAEGKLTLPLIYGLANASDTGRTLLQRAIRERSSAELVRVLDVITSCGALDYTHRRAREVCHQAATQLETLPDTPHRRALEQITDFSIARIS